MPLKRAIRASPGHAPRARGARSDPGVRRPVSVEEPTRSSHVSTSNAGAAHLWEGPLLNLSSNCERARGAMPAHHWISPENGVPDQRLCKERCAKEKCCSDVVFQPRGGPGQERMLRAFRARHGGAKVWGPSSLGFLRAHTGKQYRRCGVLRERAWEV